MKPPGFTYDASGPSTDILGEREGIIHVSIQHGGREREERESSMSVYSMVGDWEHIQMCNCCQ